MTLQQAAVREVPMKYDSTCSKCGTSLPRGTRAMWDRRVSKVWCVECPGASIEPRPAVDGGAAGASARRIYERGIKRHEHQLDERSGTRFAGLIKRFAHEPQSIRAWGIGAEGEELLGAALGAVEGLIVLNDRSMKNSKANIDHIAIAPAGVFVIDAKNFRGFIEVVDKGSFLRSDLRLMVGGRNRSDLTEKVGPQLKAVSKALLEADVDPLPPVTGVLCFVCPSWAVFRRPKAFEGVRFESENTIAAVLGSPVVLDAEAIDRLARILADALPPR